MARDPKLDKIHDWDLEKNLVKDLDRHVETDLETDLEKATLGQELEEKPVDDLSCIRANSRYHTLFDGIANLILRLAW